MMSMRKIKRKILGRIAQMTMAALYEQEATSSGFDWQKYKERNLSQSLSDH